VAEPPIVVSAPITTTARKTGTITTATFTHAGGVEAASAFTATIKWGDGKTSTGTITQSGTTYTVKGSHRYTGGGSHTITTTVTEVGTATELLLAKVGDEVPELNEPYQGNVDHGRPPHSYNNTPATERKSEEDVPADSVTTVATAVNTSTAATAVVAGSSSPTATNTPTVLAGVFGTTEIDPKKHGHAISDDLLADMAA